MLIWWVSGFFLIFAPAIKNFNNQEISITKQFIILHRLNKAGGIVRSLTFWYNNVL